MEEILLLEYKKRIEKIKSEEELERITLDEIKTLKQKIFVEYDNENSRLEELKEQVQAHEKKLIKLKNEKIKENDYILQMEDNTYEIASKDDIEIVSDMNDIQKLSASTNNKIALLQIHFTEIEENKYKELQERDWCPFIDLMDYSAKAVIRFYNEIDDKLIQLEWDIPREDVIKAENLYVKKDSFWIEPDNDDDYSYMALIWNGNV